MSDSSLDAIRAGEAAAKHALANPLPNDTHEPTPAAARRAYPGRDAALAEGRDPAAEAARASAPVGKRPAGV